MEAVAKITDFSIEEVLAQNNELRCKLEARDHHIKLLEEKINHLIYHRFSPKSERFDGRQLLLFDYEDTACEVEPATKVEIPTHTRKTGGRRILPQNLPLGRVEHDLSEKEKQCICGDYLNRIGEELNLFLDSPRVHLIQIDEETAGFYAEIYWDLRRKGKPVPSNDMWVAASAMKHGLALFTFDEHFNNINVLLLKT
ncbi:MAG: PIN domain-containing protein [Candidatus Scalindua sp.]|nr:PIN domain-containing protein [Candidatus Scalindua sp.]